MADSLEELASQWQAARDPLDQLNILHELIWEHIRRAQPETAQLLEQAQALIDSLPPDDTLLMRQKMLRSHFHRASGD